MIIRQRTSWWKMLFIWKGSVLRKIIPQLLIIGAFAITVLYFKGSIYHHKVHLNPAIFTLLGLSLAIFMGFCNTASYDRFWEGRRLWGTLVNDSRSLCRQVLTLVDNTTIDREEKQRFVKMVAAFAWALNYQLRNKSDLTKLEKLLSKEDFDEVKSKQFKPVVLLKLMGTWIKNQNQKGNIDTIVLAAIDSQLNALSQIIGGCERIANTPLPFAYTILLHRTVYIYCFWLPFGLVDVVGWMMPVVVVFISYTFIALDAVIQEIQDPFGEEENDLALDNLCQNLQYSVFELAGIPQPELETSNNYYIN